VSETTLKFITGQKPLSEYDEFKAQIEKLGARKLEEIHNNNIIK
jgi:hypothetical protein